MVCMVNSHIAPQADSFFLYTLINVPAPANLRVYCWISRRRTATPSRYVDILNAPRACTGKSGHLCLLRSLLHMDWIVRYSSPILLPNT